MLNPLKKSIFDLYCIYFERVPLLKGKYRLAQMLNKLFGYAIYDLNGIQIELNPIGFIDRKIISGKGHDPIVAEIIYDKLSQGGTFIDIGANVGYFSIMAAKMQNVKVFAFEPSPRELSRLYRNILINKCSNITVFPYGLSEENKILPLYISGDSNPGLNSTIQIRPNSESIECHFVALDSLLAESTLSNVRVCKIDVEGFEMSVLKGMAKSMQFMDKATFVIEVSAKFLPKLGYKQNDIYEFFESYGYQGKFGMLNLSQYDEIFYKPNIN
jgi:FkbM family methyltransferase